TVEIMSKYLAQVHLQRQTGRGYRPPALPNCAVGQRHVCGVEDRWDTVLSLTRPRYTLDYVQSCLVICYNCAITFHFGLTPLLSVCQCPCVQQRNLNVYQSGKNNVHR
ncbi:hypothetical protein J6590_010776, partial [Homalodisca vitripennis]